MTQHHKDALRGMLQWHVAHCNVVAHCSVQRAMLQCATCYVAVATLHTATWYVAMADKMRQNLEAKKETNKNLPTHDICMQHSIAGGRGCSTKVKYTN